MFLGHGARILEGGHGIMAAYISVPRDLTRVKSKVMFNLTKRQLICFSIGALLGVPTYFLLKKTGNTSLAAMGMIVIMLPMFFLAMYERDGQPLEVILKQIIDATFIRPRVRPYKTDNYYEALMRQYQAEKEVNKIVSRAEKQAGRPAASEEPFEKRKKRNKKGHRKSKEERRHTQNRAAVHSVSENVSGRDLPGKR